jgi:hypothetical protein
MSRRPRTLGMLREASAPNSRRKEIIEWPEVAQKGITLFEYIARAVVLLPRTRPAPSTRPIPGVGGSAHTPHEQRLLLGFFSDENRWQSTWNAMEWRWNWVFCESSKQSASHCKRHPRPEGLGLEDESLCRWITWFFS